MEVIKKLDMSDTEKLIFLSEEILPEMICQIAKFNQIHATALAAAVVGDILRAVFDRFDAAENGEEVAHGPRS